MSLEWDGRKGERPVFNSLYMREINFGDDVCIRDDGREAELLEDLFLSSHI